MQDREFYDGDLVPGTRYRVTSLMGLGGMGTVYEVEHVELGRRFVLKALMRELARRQDLVQRLRNEWRALGRLEHPNIVSVTDAGTTSTGVPYYVMERLEGETLAARLRRVRRLTVPEALEIAAGVLEGLSAAHEIGVIHRDVKPPNIFLLSGDRPKVLDFGVAKIADAANVVTARGVAVGTPRYMSPEQARGINVDGRSDVYAVGLLLFEMITGVGPFDDARDANEMLLAHLGREAPRLGSMAMGVLPELDEIVGTMLAKDARLRPGSARALAARLRAIIDGYSERISTTGPTPIAAYSSTTAQIVSDSPTRDLTTRPDGMVTSSPTELSGTQSTLVEAPPSWQLTDAPSSGELPTVALQSLPLPPQAYAQSAAHVSPLPAHTLLEPTPTGFTSQPGGMATTSSRRRGPVSTVRLGSNPELHRDWGEPTERLADDRIGGEHETRTHVPQAEPPTLGTPLPVVPSGNVPPAKRRGFVGMVAVGVVAAGVLGWLVTSPANDRASVPPASTVPATRAPAAAPLPAAPPDALPQAKPTEAESVVPPSAAAPLPPPEPAAVQPQQTPGRPPLAKARPRGPLPPRAKTAEKPASPASPPPSLLPASGL